MQVTEQKKATFTPIVLEVVLTSQREVEALAFANNHLSVEKIKPGLRAAGMNNESYVESTEILVELLEEMYLALPHEAVKYIGDAS